MSTKNLSRTVIEGGRYRGNRWERRHSSQVLRVETRQYCRELRKGDALDAELPPLRAPVPRSFSDKLSPAERWLESQVGRPWSKVRSELFQRFDTRTTAGRHIVFDHMLPSVEGRGWHATFRVDERGMLRKLPERRWPRREVPAPLPEARGVLVGWLAGRAVDVVGPHLYWFDKTLTGYFRQAQALDGTERARWLALPAWFREEMNVAGARRREREKETSCTI